MLTIVRRTASLWWQTWPWLVAIYLVGWLVRFWALQLAVHVGLAYGQLWGSLILPLAALTRLLTYLAMFMVIRSVASGLRDVVAEKQRPRGVFDVVLSAILPFLVIYTAWRLILEDYFVYLTTVDYAAVNQGATSAELTGSNVGIATWITIGITFAVRHVITRFRDRLPSPMLIIAAYLDVVWLYLALKASLNVLFGSPRWISERRVVVWLADLRDDVLSHFGWLHALWSVTGGAVGLLVPALGLALAWLAIAGVVYGTPLPPTWAGARRAFLGHRGGAAAQAAVERGRDTLRPRWQRIPGGIRSRVTEFARGLLGRFAPIVDAARLILHGGAVPIAFFVVLYTALVVLAPAGAYFDKDVTDGYLFRGLALLFGPHDWWWWQTYEQTIRAGVGALVDPIRVALVAATYWYCVDRVRAQRDAEASVRVEPDDRADVAG
ncbi:MAG TPA: hypothetical protein VH496_21615 [Mycobacterium sp.]